ncbi:MAG: arginine--tRNA ligase, partial [Flavobacteriales bacterium]|nr:arginine--tRNA ligase [Flavobacteriales bacterium]
MNRIEPIIHASVKSAVKALFEADLNDGQVQIQKTRKEFKGDVTVVVFPFVKLAKRSPEDTAKVLGEKLMENEAVVGFNVVKGFLNLEIAPSYWMNFFESCFNDSNYGIATPDSKPQVMVEYSSPNTNKPLHLGHMRNNFLGYSVSRILEANGHDVVKVQIINDRGIHICKSMVAWQQFAEGATPESEGIKGDHFVGKYYVKFDQEYKRQITELNEKGIPKDEAENKAAIMVEAREMLKRWEAGEEEAVSLWKMMNGWVYSGFEITYEEMGVAFDKLYYESDTYLKGLDEVKNGLDKGVFTQREDGSIWCDLTNDGLDQKLVLRSDGTAVYMTQDIGTAILRFQDYPDLSYQIYTVGNEQEYHFKVLFLILEKLGFAQAKDNFHLSYGMVELPEGKMKSREGTVVDADELMEEMAQTAKEITDELGKLDGIPEEEREELYKSLGYGAIKYFLLKVDPRKSMMFNPEESVDFNGNTAPYIQYNYVRTRALLRKADTSDFEIDTSIEPQETERELIKMLYRFPEVIEEAASSYDPSTVANYCYELVRQYS